MVVESPFFFRGVLQTVRGEKASVQYYVLLTLVRVATSSYPNTF